MSQSNKQITHVESADTLKTARKINGIEFDGTKDINVCGENELPMQQMIINKEGWYRFAEIHSSSSTFIIQIARHYGTKYPEVYSIIFDETYHNCQFTVLSSLFNELIQHIPKVRAIHKHGTVYLELYYTLNESHLVTTKLANITLSDNSDSVINIEYTVGSIPEGFSVTEFDLSAKLVTATSLQIGDTTITEEQLKALLATIT